VKKHTAWHTLAGMRLILLFSLSVVAVVFLLAGCGGGGGGESSDETTMSEETTTSSAETTAVEGGDFAEVGLAPTNGSGASGTATFTDVSQGVRVDLVVQGLPEPNATYLTHIHPGTCADEQGGAEGEHDSNHEGEHPDHEEAANHEDSEMAEIEYPLPPITPDPQGRGTITTVLDGVTVEQLFSGNPKYINVHAEGTGNPPAIACSPLSPE
jgi:hypothetical protein